MGVVKQSALNTFVKLLKDKFNQLNAKCFKNLQSFYLKENKKVMFMPCLLQIKITLRLIKCLNIVNTTKHLARSLDRLDLLNQNWAEITLFMKT